MRLQVEALLQTEVLPQVKTLLQTEVFPQVEAVLQTEVFPQFKTLRIRFRWSGLLVGL
ncbi:hypothetical protein [Slackia sp. CM382]|uniref:hypothetical protein n=1 Tax=Slackia sp. CM382 TaxID=1111137 RepID=UPI0012DE86DB|nr:hypothetical protein [Slackia sp. CM382]